jgi:hypothetical protein
MQRHINIDIDFSSWPKPPAKPSFPASFHQGSAAVSIHFPSFLVGIGILTTPTAPIGPTLSQYWAYVRYLTAITPGPDLRITKAFASLDSHQKTILSDDFGMGLPMYWLWDALDAVAFCDGQYFIKHLAASVGAKVPKKAARGPNKSPDFVLLDANGDWHVVECKGTQSGPGYRDKQLGKKRPKPTGGIAQKNTIVFPNENLGQRLACGVSIGVQGGPHATNMKIVDPTKPAVFTVQEEWLTDAKEVMLRAMLARALRLAGYEATATYVAANRPIPSKKGIRPSVTLDRLGRLRGLAEAELKNDMPDNRTSFVVNKRPYSGRKLALDLSTVSDQFGVVTVQQGIARDFAEQLLALDISGERRDHLAPAISELVSGVKVLSEDEKNASLQIGSAFRVDLSLGSRRPQRRTAT